MFLFEIYSSDVSQGKREVGANREDDANYGGRDTRERLRADGGDEDGEDDEDQVAVDGDPAQGRQDEGGEDRLGHLDEVSEGGRADGQAAVGHQCSVG